MTVGHDEYWSSEMRDHVEQFADNGGTVVILSGNSVWWQIRFDDEPAITCYKNRELDPVSDRTLVTVNWIDRELNRPETLLTGVSFQYGALITGDGISDAPVFEAGDASIPCSRARTSRSATHSARMPRTSDAVRRTRTVG